MEQAAIQKLIDHLQQGRSEALQEVYTYCKDHCINKLIKYGECTVEDAEDLFMDAILAFRQNVLSGKVQHITKLREYIYTICLNHKRTRYLQQQRTDQAKYEVTQQLYEQPLEDFILEKTDDDPQWEALATEAFEQLNEKCQEIIQSFYYEDLSLKEIAKQMRLANGNVAKVLKCRCYKQWMKNAEALKKRKNG